MNTTTAAQLLARIDFELLAEQKAYLLSLPAAPEIEGLIHLLDAIQDAAETTAGA